MNARQKAKKYKKLLEIERSRAIKPTVVYTEHNINHFCVEELVPNSFIKEGYELAANYAIRKNMKKLIAMALQCAEMRVEDVPKLDAKLVRHDLWVVNRGKSNEY